tara:strand:+ start:458 stop:622 length:165 start_codon:yes stop_codon:yes gene_type:complete
MMTTKPTWRKQLAAFKDAAKGTGRAEWADGGQIRTIMFKRGARSAQGLEPHAPT